MKESNVRRSRGEVVSENPPLDAANLLRQIEAQNAKLIRNNEKLQNAQQELVRLRETVAEKETSVAALKQELQQLTAQKATMNPNEMLQQLRDYMKNMKQLYGAAMLARFEDDPVDPDEMTYQELLELEQRIGKVSKGLSRQKMSLIVQRTCQSNERCTICCEEFESSTLCSELPCRHQFHEECLGGWIKNEKTCPLCKREIE